MAEKSIPADIAKLSFEDALAQLEEIVGGLEKGTQKLDEAIAAYERGTVLKQHCETKLQEAKARIDKITVSADGTVSAAPAEIE